jgi:hypothetical protein
LSQLRILLILLAVVGLAATGAWILFVDDLGPADDVRVELAGASERNDNAPASVEQAGEADQPTQDSVTSPT